MTQVVFTVDDHELRALVTRIETQLDTIVEEFAEEIAKTAAEEARERSTKLGAEWKVEGHGATERSIIAPEWWAHFLSGGTKAHGPRTAKRLTFEANGEQVFARFVGGIAADPFDERAIENADLDGVLRRVIEFGV